MSNHFSPAQALPLDIIHLILNWVVIEKKSPIHENRHQLDHLKELLTVSSVWRQAALEILWRQLNFFIDVWKNKVILQLPYCLKNYRLPHSAANLVKEIHVSFSMSGVVSGVAHKLLVDYIGDTKCFPLANKLTVERVDFGSESVDSKDVAISNALGFAKLLKSIAPSAMTIDVNCGAGHDSQRNTYDNLDRLLNHELVVILADELYVNTERAHLNFIDDNMCNLSIVNYIPPLSKLIVYFDNTPNVFASLVHRSASTLQYLDIGLEDANKLVFDSDGEAVIYQNLQHLRMYGYARSQFIEVAKASDTVQFPMLRTLRLNFWYPFHDDVLFRGNAATLEYLDFLIYTNTLIMLSQRRVFEGKHKVLQHVKIGMFDIDMRNIVNNGVDINKFISDLVSTAKRLSVINPSREIPFILAAAQHGQGFLNITVFGTHGCNLLLSDALSILKVLPSLVELRSKIISPGPGLENIPADGLPDHVAFTYGDVGKNLQIWRLDSFNICNPFEKIDYILILALVCPKLRQIQLKYHSIQGCRIKIADALNSQVFCRHAQQLSRIPNIIRE